MSLVETQSARAQQLSSYSGHTLWLDSTFIWQPYLDRSFLPIQIWVRLKFLFLFELKLWHDFIQLLYIYFIRGFFPYSRFPNSGWESSLHFELFIEFQIKMGNISKFATLFSLSVTSWLTRAYQVWTLWIFNYHWTNTFGDTSNNVLV